MGNSKTIKYNSFRSWMVSTAVLASIFPLGFVTFSTMVSLVAIHRDLGLNIAELQWTATGYAIFGAVSISFSGQLADRLGRINIFIVGLLIFIIATILGSISSGVWTLLLSRCLAGLASGLLVPISLAIFKMIFPQNKQRLPMLIWGGVTMSCFTLAVLFGGIFSDFSNWRMTFWVMLPLPIFTLLVVLIYRHIETDVHHSQHFDPLGSTLLAISLILFTVLFSESSVWGWTSPVIITLIVITPIVIILLCFSQLFVKTPIFTLQLLRFRALPLGSMMLGLTSGIMFGVIYFFAFTVQSAITHDNSIFLSGVKLVPFFAPGIVFYFLSNWLIQRFGFFVVIMFSQLLILAGAITLAFVSLSTPYSNIWWRLVLIGSGTSLFWVIAQNFSLRNVPEQHAGKAASILEIGRYGGAVVFLNLAQVWFVEAMNHRFNTHWQQLGLSGKPLQLSAIFHDNPQLLHQILVSHTTDITSLKLAMADSIYAAFNGSMWCYAIVGAIGVVLALFVRKIK